MRATRWFRASAVLLLLFAAGHTYGFLAFRPPSAEGLAVWHSMNEVRFAMGHSTFSYGGFYVGFGLFITAFYLFTAWLAWWMGSMARRSSGDAEGLAWGMLVLELISLSLALKYFGAGPAVLSAAAVFCLAFGIVSVRKATAGAYASAVATAGSGA